MSTLKDALAVYLADMQNPNLDVRNGTLTTCYLSYTDVATTTCNAMGFSVSVHVSSTAGITNPRDVSGIGWLPVDFTKLSEGAPFSILPIDPINNDTYFYAYIPSGRIFKLVTTMESIRYGIGGSGDVESNSIDNGLSDAYYEVGTGLGL